ncbi:glycosyltransferase [Vibrio harveyi]
MSTSKSVAFILPSLKQEAPIFVAVSIAKQLIANGVSISVFYFSGEPSNSILKELEGADTIERISWLKNTSLENYDIVHSHMFISDVYTFLYKLTFFWKDITVVSTLHNYMYEELFNYRGRVFSLFWGTVWNLSWINKSKLFALTKHSKDYYLKTSFNKKVGFVYNGRDVDVDYKSFDSSIVSKIKHLKSKKEILVGTYCNLIERKNVDLLIEYAKENKNSGVVIFGDGPEKVKLKKLVSTLRLENDVLFFDAVKNAHQYNYFFDVYAMTSKSEGFGLALVEAALHKKKIVCTSIPVFREIFTEDEVSFFESGDSKSFAMSVDIAMTLPNKAESAYVKAKKYYSEYNMYLNYKLEYDKLINPRGDA